jgi:hypothetical protein
MKQFNEDGTIRGHSNKNGTYDIGFMQINSIHLGEAESMGYNLDTLYGNVMFSLWLYDKEGTSPWNPSKQCWESSV